MRLIRNLVSFIIFLLIVFGILYLSVPKVKQVTDNFISNIIKKDETEIAQEKNQNAHIDYENKIIKVEVIL